VAGLVGTPILNFFGIQFPLRLRLAVAQLFLAAERRLRARAFRLPADDFLKEDEELDLVDETVSDFVLVMVSEVEPSVLVMAPEKED